MKSTKNRSNYFTALSFSRMKVFTMVKYDMQPGMMLLGYVKEVMKRHLMIGLPFNLSGQMRYIGVNEQTCPINRNE